MFSKLSLSSVPRLVKSQRYLSNSIKFIPSSPLPVYDTGCTYCQIPKFPEPIDFEKDLNGTKVIPWKHVLILSHGIENFDDMPSKVEMVPNSVNSEIESLKRGLISAFHPIMVSNILLTNHNKLLKQFQINNADDQLAYIYPDRKIVKFSKKDTKQFIQHFLVPPPNDTQDLPQVYNPFKPASSKKTTAVEKVDESIFEEFPIEKDLVLICGHTQRDIRCGKLGPILRTEFEEVLSIENLDDCTELGLVSHIGGHAYAGNVIYFPEDKEKQVIWYGRVFPPNVQGIVRETIKKGNVIKDLYRGEV